MAFDWNQVGVALGTLTTVALGAWAAIERYQKVRANTRADIAESHSDRTIAEANTTVYAMLTQRLTTLESEISTLRQEHAAERVRGRKLEIHIWKLENLMRQKGLEPPVFDAAIQ